MNTTARIGACLAKKTAYLPSKRLNLEPIQSYPICPSDSFNLNARSNKSRSRIVLVFRVKVEAYHYLRCPFPGTRCYSPYEQIQITYVISVIQWHLSSCLRVGRFSSPRNSRVAASRGSSQSRDRSRFSCFFFLFSSSASPSRYTRSIPGWPRSAPSSRVDTRSEVSRGDERLPRRGNNGGYFARAIDTSLSPFYMGSVILSFPRGARYQSCIFIVGVPHLSLASSLLSLLPAIVSHTSGSYVVVVVVEAISLLLGPLAPSTWHRFYFAVRKTTVLRKGTRSVEEHCALNVSESRERVFSLPLQFRWGRWDRCESRVYLFRDCSCESS